MKSKNEIMKIVKCVARKMEHMDNSSELLESCPISIIDIVTWEWAQGVGIYGLLKLYQMTKDEQLLDFLVGWFEKNFEKGLPDKNVNTMCPMLTLSYVYEYTGEKKYLDLCMEWAEWIMNEMPRTKYMGLQHIVSGEINEHQLWDDTLFMTVLFLARMGELTGRRDYLDESVRQFLVHIQFLLDNETGLLFHGWTFDGHHNFANAKWARGNCWYTVVLPEYLAILGEIDQGVKMYLISVLEQQVRTLEKMQNENGMWNTLLDDNDSYEETSATAGFGYGILKAVRCGYLDEKFRYIGEKALEAVLDRIQPDGEVTEVSYGTGMGKDLEYYHKIPLCPMTYGQALAILLLAEGMEQAEKRNCNNDSTKKIAV